MPNRSGITHGILGARDLRGAGLHPEQLLLSIDPSEDVLRDEIEKLASAYPTYGYRRIRKLLVQQGYPVGYKRVTRLMKEDNLSVCVKRVCCQTTRVSETARFPWVNHLESLEVSVSDQVWVGDITYVQLKGRFVYVALFMEVFTS